VLGEIGDEQALHALRARLAVVNRERYALVVAVGELKRKLGFKQEQREADHDDPHVSYWLWCTCGLRGLPGAAGRAQRGGAGRARSRRSRLCGDWRSRLFRDRCSRPC
jgi:hypothetical protein